MSYYQKNSFQSEKYDTLERFISYYYQINLIRKLKPQTLLEIGIGGGLTNYYLKKLGIKTTTCDINVELLPDKIGDIRNLPFKDGMFDAVVAFEVLEHIPFSDFDLALREIHRVSKKYAIISLPYRHACFEMILKFPLIRTIFKKSFLGFCLRIPLFFRNNKNLGQHQWELGLRHYSLRRIKKHLGKYFKILQEVGPALNSYHQFFVLEKLD